MYNSPFPILLTQEEQKELEEIITKPKSEHRMVVRCTIILLLHQGLRNKEISQRLSISVKTVSKWRLRYHADGLTGLNDAPRSGRKHQFSPTVRFEVMHLACTDPEKVFTGVTKWSYRKLAKAMIQLSLVNRVSFTRVMTWLKAMKIKPYKIKYYLKPTDPKFREKMLAIVFLYHNPPDDGVLVCVDEKTGIKVHMPLYPDKDLGVGKIARESHYQRKGTVSLFSGFEVQTGLVTSLVRVSHKTEDFIAFLLALLERYSGHQKIHLVLDNSSIHRSKKLKAWLIESGLENRFEFHFLPAHGSWLNQVEIWFGIFSRDCLSQAVCDSKESMIRLIHAYVDTYNKSFAHPFDWKYGKNML